MISPITPPPFFFFALYSRHAHCCAEKKNKEKETHRISCFATNFVGVFSMKSAVQAAILVLSFVTLHYFLPHCPNFTP